MLYFFIFAVVASLTTIIGASARLTKDEYPYTITRDKGYDSLAVIIAMIMMSIYIYFIIQLTTNVG